MDGRKESQAELRKLIEESTIMSDTTHPELFPEYTKICEDAGILAPPTIRVLPHLPGAYANVEHDTIFIGAPVLDHGYETLEEKRCVLSHELGHIIRGHTVSTPRTEREADSLMVLLAGEAQPHIDSLSRNKELNDDFLQTREGAPMTERLLMGARRWGQERLYKKLYGPFEDRIAHLEKVASLPADSAELSYWKDLLMQAVRDYNASKSKSIG